MNRSLGLVSGLVLCAVGAASFAFGVEKPASKRPRAPVVSLADQEAAKAAQQAIIQGNNAADSFGLQCCQVLQIPASSFIPVAGQSYENDDLDGYTTVTAFGTTDNDLMATITLPSGAHMMFVDLYYNDTNVSNDLSVTVFRLGGGNPGAGGSGAPFHAQVGGTLTSTGSAGFGYSVMAVDHTILNNAALDVNAGQYTVYISFPTTNGSVSFKGVDIWWQRQVSPAPGTPTFADVPPSNQFYQYIEALAASGITQGVGGGLYNPNGVVTRGQLAKFLATALGLYFPF